MKNIISFAFISTLAILSSCMLPNNTTISETQKEINTDDKNLDSLNIWSLNIDKSTNRIYFYNFISGNLPIPDKITEIDLEKGIVDYSGNKLLDIFIGNFIFDNIGNFYIITYKDNKSYIYRIVKNINKKELLAETDNRLNHLVVDNKNNLIYVVASSSKIYKVKIQEKI